MNRVALDSNILAYLAGVERSEADRAKIRQIPIIIEDIDEAAFVVPVQALGELFVVLRKAAVPAIEAQALLARFAKWAGATPASERRTALAAAEVVVDHKLQYWDAMIVSAAADAGCSILLSEDMQNGFVARGVTVVNPFAEDRHPKLAALFSGK
jgi:predicted nucleic acid-binding protein